MVRPCNRFGLNTEILKPLALDPHFLSSLHSPVHFKWSPLALPKKQTSNQFLNMNYTQGHISGMKQVRTTTCTMPVLIIQTCTYMYAHANYLVISSTKSSSMWSWIPCVQYIIFTPDLYPFLLFTYYKKTKSTPGD